ncbi:potassium/sodium efflux P-type ATPase, fungal-type [Aphanomyces invadans]|uniref:Potassium/sodium efflux P-type ATPase, fungal-type n=1 Tax=Aphanomyces invadans TaxID=157072 RepID=A0A024TVL0_9STRA|nr:potassium/sodium efflux P-type ATPase, fungal-type [Aphanomyces invadans]ETV98014.1 potassium/sodium efflux P-type ATPase, fungal-type [Aphanomyces invadans]|eukprot:XP_008873575.1 potassium/sodium efflux P-type ATPase, fungal-type [Aphanomyces invadans]
MNDRNPSSSPVTQATLDIAHEHLLDGFASPTTSYAALEPGVHAPDAAAHEAAALEEREHSLRHLSAVERSLVEDVQQTRRTLSQLHLENQDEAATAGDGATLWYTLSPEDCAVKLSSNLTSGLTTADADKLLEVYGRNELDQVKPQSALTTFLMQFVNLIVIMLIISAIASLLIGHTAEGIVILFIVTLNASISTYQEKSAESSMAALAKLSSPTCVVVRDGTQAVLETARLVPGDVIKLVPGDLVPADIVLVQNSDFFVSEVLLTGESKDVAKTAKYVTDAAAGLTTETLLPTNMCFSSTTVTEGNATGVVVETGMSTKVGRIARLLKGSSAKDADESKTEKPSAIRSFVNKVRQPFLDQKANETPLQAALHRVGVLMGMGAITICVVVFFVGLIRQTRDPTNPDRSVALTMLLVAVSLAVSAIPEGLPMVVTICLTVGTSDMVKKNVVVRRLAAVETLGCASVVCTDKTGTLTEGKMTVVKVWGDFLTYVVTGKGFAPTGDVLLDGKPEQSWVGTNTDTKDAAKTNVQLLSTLGMAVLCSNTVLTQTSDDDSGDDSPANGRWTCVGNASEAPLVVCAAKLRIWKDNLDAQHPRVAQIAFSSKTKMMVSIHSVNETHDHGFMALPNMHPPHMHGGAAYTAFIGIAKGAPNKIVDLATHILGKDGQVRPLTPSDKNAIMKFVDDTSSEALRVLAVAYAWLDAVPWEKPDGSANALETEGKLAAFTSAATSSQFVLAGLFASVDPERDGVKESVQMSRDAGIRTVMITGDYLKTAIAIAKNINLFGENSNASDDYHRIDMDKPEHLTAVDCTALRPHGAYLSNEEIDALTARTVVFARAQPEDKLEIVKSLRRQGLVSAMTGDGVNDAPALKEADIGVAMGITGTSVAKGASDMVLSDDNFCSIVAAVERGRVIYANIQKLVVFLLSTNVGEILLILTTIVVGMPIPLEPLQILMLNLLSDGMPGVALSMERGDSSIMSQPPRPKKQHIIHGKTLMVSIVGNALIIFLVTLGVYSTALFFSVGGVLQADLLDVDRFTSADYHPVCSRYNFASGVWESVGFGPEFDINDDNCARSGISMARTVTFVSITMSEVVRAYTVRSFTAPVWVGMFENKYLHVAAALSLALTLGLIHIPGVNTVFGLVHLMAWQWLLGFGGPVLTIVFAELLKCASHVVLRQP